MYHGDVMEYLPNGFSLEIPQGCFPLSTDSMVLAHFVRLPRNARVLDLGSGCGTLGLLLCAGDPACQVTGLEQDSHAHAAAEENIRRNGLCARMSSVCTDLRRFSQEAPCGSFSVCISNPPYFSGGPESAALARARKETDCTLAQLIQAAGRMLKYGGDFFLVHRPERLAQIIALGASAGLEAKELLLLRHRVGGPVNLILLRLRKGGKPGLILREESLFDAAGEPTAFYREVYHLNLS